MNNNVETPENKLSVHKDALKPLYNIFGNKGSVWSDECHIAKSDLSGRTLCGVPMLSNNWARIEKVDVAKCPNCVPIYLEQIKTL
jgi:hypothetical protein